MQKIIKTVDEERGIVQVTCADERWYLMGDKAVPSVTWIAGKYPKGIGFYMWLADKGWDEAMAIRDAAGIRGTKVHNAINDILSGYEVRIDSLYENPKNGHLDELTLEECDSILSFKKWWAVTEKDYKIEPLTWDRTIFSEAYNYAGTIDLVVRLTDRVTGSVRNVIIDFKTSSDVWTEYELQVSAYKQGLVETNGSGVIALEGVKDYELMILQLGYKRNKAGYKVNDIDDVFQLFLTTRMIWEREHGGEQPKKKDYPVVLSAGVVRPTLQAGE